MKVRSWDIFCTIIDNFGDIGVTWRLAKQLAHEHQQVVHLWVDDLRAFHKIEPCVNADLLLQIIQSIHIHLWDEAHLSQHAPSEIVIEAFACRLPDFFERKIAKSQPTPLWLNLDYLSAEDWVESCHEMVSPHPQLGLKKIFYFPGFTEKTGGLICEQSLFAMRDKWLANQQDEKLWDRLAIPQKQADEIRISLFSYPTESIPQFLQICQAANRPISLLIPVGKALESIAPLLGLELKDLKASSVLDLGQVRLYILPMTDQEGYDRLLWSCDLNIVRGEDSFLRAQWAGRPFIWHIYPQEDNAHLDKLNAFLQHYANFFPKPLQQLIQSINTNWNTHLGLGQIDPSCLFNTLKDWEILSKKWANYTIGRGDLATRLVETVEKHIK